MGGGHVETGPPPVERDAASPATSYSQILGDLVSSARGDVGARRRVFGDGSGQSPLRTRLDRDITDAAIGSSAGTRGQYLGGLSGAVGTMQGLTLDHGDELYSALTGEDIDRVREEFGRAEQQNPWASGLARGSAALGMGAAIPGAGAGVGMAGRLGVGIAQGASMGALSAHGQSTADTSEGRLADMPAAALAGGAAAGVFGLLGEGVASGARRLPAVAEWLRRRQGRSQQAADEALLAATTSTGRGKTAVENFDFGDSPEQIVQSRQQAAQALRDTRVVPSVGTVGDVRRRVEAALSETTSDMQRVREAMGGEGVERAEVARRLREAARQRTTTAGEPYRDVLNDFATRVEAPQRASLEPAQGGAGGYRRAYVESLDPLTYDDVIAESADLRSRGAWRTRPGRDVELPTQARRDIDRAIRDSYDDAVEQQLGADERAAYQEARHRFAVLRNAQENAVAGEAAAAGNRGMGLSEQLALYGISGTTGAASGNPLLGAATGVGGALAARAYRAVEPTLRASVAAGRARAWTGAADLVSRLAREQPQRLGRYAESFRRALQDAAPAEGVAAQHFLLSQQDPEYRQLVQQLEEEENR